MSSDKKTRLKKIINHYKNVISLVSQETNQTIKHFFKIIDTYSYEDELEEIQSKNILWEKLSANSKPLKPQIPANIKDLTFKIIPIKPKLHKIMSSDIKQSFKAWVKNLNYHFSEPKVKEITEFDIYNKKSYDIDLGIDLILGRAKDFYYSESEISSRNLPIMLPEFTSVQNESFDIKTTTFDKSSRFLTNLPIEKKPDNILGYNNEQLDYFRELLALKAGINKRIIKINSIYSKLNLKNLETIKHDTKVNNLYYIFKPKSMFSAQEHYYFFIVGIRLDTKGTLSTIVNQNDFHKKFNYN